MSGYDKSPDYGDPKFKWSDLSFRRVLILFLILAVVIFLAVVKIGSVLG